MYQWLQRLLSSRQDPPAPAAARALPDAAAAAPPSPASCLSEAPAPPAGVAFDQLDRVNGLYYRWLFDSSGEPDLDTNLLETEVLEAVAAVVGSQQSGAALVRRMPGLIPD